VTERDIFIGALQRDDPAERRAYLDAACGADPDLRARVNELLAVHDRAVGFLEQPIAPVPEPRTAALVPGQGTATFAPGSPAPTAFHDPSLTEIGDVLAGRYKLVEALGEGGMGAVWMAQQIEPVKQAVAVKLIKAGMDSTAVLARFEAERQALALMDHPNIAKVLDAGAAPDGRPFFVMELVKGVPITRFCDDRRFTLRQPLGLFVPVCQAIQHAHQKGVIHRDIKPSNVLVALHDDKPVPKVIDFGVAKAAGQPLTDRTLTTGFGALVGTPEYMSPEQASFDNPDVDTRSGVYALGALLYELLAGSPPHPRKELEKAGLMEVLRVIREVEPPRPSTRLGSPATPPTTAAARGGNRGGWPAWCAGSWTGS
jgi:serine/threonine protein kinase